MADLAAVRRLSALSDVHKLLSEAVARERAIDGELEALLARRGEQEARLAALQAATAEVREAGGGGGGGWQQFQ